jgi:hypothetical protein
MHTYEDRIRVNEIEFYVPSISLEDVNFNALQGMVFGALMMPAVTPVNDRYQLLGRNIAAHQGIFVLDTPASLVLIRTFFQCLCDAMLDFLEWSTN